MDKLNVTTNAIKNNSDKILRAQVFVEGVSTSPSSSIMNGSDARINSSENSDSAEKNKALPQPGGGKNTPNNILLSSRDKTEVMRLGDRLSSPPPPPTPSPQIFLNSIIAGSVAGMTNAVLFHPLEVLRTKIQAISMTRTRRSPVTTTYRSSPARRTVTPVRPLSIFIQTFRHGGIPALYTGLSPVFMAQAGYKATLFTVNNLCRDILTRYKTNERRKLGIYDPYQLNKLDIFVCGSMGGIVNAKFLVTPVEFVRNQLIAQHSKLVERRELLKERGLVSSLSEAVMKRKGPIDVVKSTLRRHGLFGLWRGVSVAVARDSIGCGLYFVMFETSRDYLAPYFQHDGGRNSFTVTLLSGACAGLTYWFSALPFDTVKTWVQTGSVVSGTGAVATSLERYGLAYTIGKLYRGWQVALGRAAPSAAVTLATYSVVYAKLCELE